MSIPGTRAPRSHDRAWRRALAKYEAPDPRRSIWQLVNSFGPYVVIWVAMYASLSVSFWLTLALAPLAAGFLVRIFIIGHDCGHGSFFRSRRLNDAIGSVCFTAALTPYGSWRYQHSVHHAHAGNLDQRDLGDVWTLTVAEYEAAPWWRRTLYRFYRFPLVMFILGPLFQFFIANRFFRPHATPRERASVMRTNLALAAVLVLAWVTIGLKAFAMVQLPIMIFAGIAGVWLFYVQHQFDGVYWERKEQWDYLTEALEGSSFYDLPAVLQWFSGNIGYHHVHHLSPRIPNYFLERCHREQELFRNARRLTLRSALRCLRFRLWDEDRRELVGFGDIRPAGQHT